MIIFQYHAFVNKYKCDKHDSTNVMNMIILYKCDEHDNTVQM